MSDKKPIAAIIAIIMVVLISIATYIYFSTQKQTYTETTTKQAETAGGEAVQLNNISLVSSILLPSQTQAFRNGINSFSLEYLDPNITEVSILDNPTIQSDGSVLVNLRATAPAGKSYSFNRVDPQSSITTNPTKGTSKPSYTFSVSINRNNYKTITITVPEYNYTNVIDL